jgi:hypothetical protein
MVGDVPASNFIGGFKEGVGFALRKCRRCLAVKTDMISKFHASDFIERTPDLHNEYLELIEAGGQKYGVTCGVNNRSPLINLIGFNVTSCLPFDIMHTLFEGVTSLHLQALLHHLIDIKKAFTLVQFDTILRTHKYDHSETKPSPINKDSDGTYHIKLTASQMMTLIRLLPFLIGDYMECDGARTLGVLPSTFGYL